MAPYRGVPVNITLTFTLVSGLALLICVERGHGFNVDTRYPYSYRDGQGGSMFGLAVSQYLSEGQNWLLVGAPRAETSQPGVKNGGAVYRCESDFSACEQLALDAEGVEMFEGRPIENKTAQWLGASVYSDPNNDMILSCAPLYMYFTKLGVPKAPTGNCFLYKANENSVKIISPCRTEHDIQSRQDGEMQCLIGEGSHISVDGGHVILGAPGTNFFQGVLFDYDLDTDTYTASVERQAQFDDSYKGYSLAAGKLGGEGPEDYVTGVPRDARLRGLVVVSSGANIKKEILKFTGEQLGEYFGASVTVGDFNGDGKDDIAVGAPLYTDYTMENTMEMGRVFVFYQGSFNGQDGERTILMGERHAQSRFGSAVETLGDVNYDGFTDLAVGAPFDGDGSGALYIFHGSARGVREVPSQIIRATELADIPGLANFGYSISAGFDQDQNLYPDILVGAYGSDQAVFLRSRPVVRVQAGIGLYPNVIDLGQKTCRTREGTNVSCFDLETCLSYSGLNVPGEIVLTLNYRLDSLSAYDTRMFFLNTTQQQSTLSANLSVNFGTSHCSSQKVYIPDDIRDKLRPITMEMNYTMVEPVVSPLELTPVLDVYIPTAVHKQAQIVKKCGSDEKCIPDLVLQASSSTSEHILGDQEEIEIQVTVVNKGEDAYEAILQMDLVGGVAYINIQNVIADVPVACEAAESDDARGSYVVCDVGNPLRAKSSVSFGIRLSPKNMKHTDYEELTFSINATSTNPENVTDVMDNNVIINIPLKAIADIQVTGVSKPEQILYNSTLVGEIKNEADIGPEVTHLYEIRNLGKSSVSRIQTKISWPSTTEDGKPLFYLMEAPSVEPSGAGRCSADPGVINPNDIDALPEDRKDDSAEGRTDYESQSAGRSRRKREIMVQKSTNRECKNDESTCAEITCLTNEMDAGEVVYITVRARIWRETLVELQSKGTFVVRANSDAVFTVQEVPYRVTPEEYDQETVRIDSLASPLDQGPGREEIPLWVIIVSIVGGVIVLFLLVLLFYKCGFFRRKKVEDMKKLTREDGDEKEAQARASVAEKTASPETEATSSAV